MPVSVNHKMVLKIKVLCVMGISLDQQFLTFRRIIAHSSLEYSNLTLRMKPLQSFKTLGTVRPTT